MLGTGLFDHRPQPTSKTRKASRDAPLHASNLRVRGNIEVSFVKPESNKRREPTGNAPVQPLKLKHSCLGLRSNPRSAWRRFPTKNQYPKILHRRSSLKHF